MIPLAIDSGGHQITSHEQYIQSLWSQCIQQNTDISNKRNDTKVHVDLVQKEKLNFAVMTRALLHLRLPSTG